MHFFFFTDRCLVLLFTLTVVSSKSNKICQKLRDHQEKIRVLGEAYGGTLFIITTSGQLFKLKLNSTLRKDSTKRHYYLNIGGEPTSHVSEKWPNVPLDLSENKNKLYALLFVQNTDYTVRKALLSSVFKTETRNWNKSLYLGKCRQSLEIGGFVTDWTVDRFERCNAITVNDNEDAFMVSRSCSYSSSTNPITFVKSGANRYDCYEPNYYCFNFDYFLSKSDSTVLAASFLAEPYNILLFIYTSGVVEIRRVDILSRKKTRASNPDWTVPIGEFIKCEATSDPIWDIFLMQQESPTTTDVPGLWHTHTWRIVIVAVLLVLNGICLVLLYRKRYKKKKKRARKRKGKCSKVKKRKKMKSPNRTSIRHDSSVDNLEYPSTQGITLTGSTIKPVGSTLTIRAESGSPLTNESNSKGSSIPKKPSFKIESTPSSATVSNPSNVNSITSAKLSLAKKKQATRKCISSLLWAKMTRNDKKKPKYPKKDNEKK